MKTAVIRIVLLFSVLVYWNASAEAKSYFRQYCPTHQSDPYCQVFQSTLESESDKKSCCEQVGEDKALAAEFEPGLYARHFGYPLELFDRCILGPQAGVVFCE